MSAPAFAGRPVVTIRGRGYPVLLPTVRDPRLHLAAVIITLQVLGQTVFGFSLSIAQILVSLVTCAVLEVGIAFFRQGILMWPASALLTGNGVAFILRVPGTQHGDWWSMHGWWIFASTAAVSLLSKHVIRYQGRHLFNPSNFGLVLCFLALGKARAEPLDFWWGPMSVWMALALALIVVGGLAILSRLKLLFIAVGFWLAFAAGIAVLAASGHSMTARWHLGPITGWSFWWLLVTSPEILIFLFFMITDPMTIPRGRPARWVYAIGVGLLATLLIAPQTTERASKIAVLASLALVCAIRPVLERLLPEGDTGPSRWARLVGGRGRIATVAISLTAAAAFAGVVVLAGVPARPDTASAGALPAGQQVPQVTVVATDGVSAQVDQTTARRIAQDIVLDLRSDADALRLRDPARAAAGAGGAWLVDLRRQIGGAAGGAIPVSTYQVERVGLTLKRGLGQGPPRILAKVTGLEQVAIYTGQPPQLERRQPATPFARTMEVALRQGHYVIVDASGAATPAITTPTPPAEVVSATGPLAGVHLQDVASQVGLDFRQGAFRFGVSADVQAMMGGGVCWLDYDNDGWLDLFVVNSYSEADTTRWEKQGGLPRTALFHNVKGSFVNVSKRSGADLPVRGEGCVAADFNGDGYTDLYVTTGSYDELLWNNGDGTFTEGAKAAGIDAFGWHSGAAVADVNGDGRPDLFVAGYTDLNTPIATAVGGFPTSYAGVRDLLYLNEGNDGHGRARFREVGVQAGLEAADFRHGLGAIFTDYNGDGRPDLYVANDEDANQLYENVAWPGGAAADPAGLGFRFEERGVAEGVADPYAGMGIASGDYNGDGRLDLFVTNSRREPYAVLRRADETDAGAPAFDNGRPAFRSAAAGSAGWGASWVDLSLDGTPDLVLANGDIPVTSLSKDAARVQVLAPGSGKRYANVGVPGLAATPDVNGRGLAAADYDNNGTVDVAVNSVGGRLVLLRNSGEKGHWLEVKLSTFSPGAVATAVLPDGRTLVDEEHAGSSYLSSEDPRLHFGLGSATTVRSLVVRFPGGRQTRLSNVRADRVVVVNPPSARPAAAKPAASYVRSNCTSLATPTRSVARIWNDALLADDPGQRRPGRAGARPLPPLRRDVGRLGRVHAEGNGLLPHREAPGGRRAGGPERGDQLRRVPASPLAGVLRPEHEASFRAPDRHDAAPLLRAGLHEYEGRLARCARQPRRRRRHRLREGGRLARESSLPRPELCARERAAGRLAARHAHARRDVLAAARVRADHDPGRVPDPGRRAVVRRLAVGPRPRLRPPGVEEGPADRSRTAHARRPERPRVQAGRRRRHPRERPPHRRSDRGALACWTWHARAVERDRGLRVGLARTRRERRCPACLGREALLRARRRAPRRGDRELGGQAHVRLRATDLDDPVARLRRPVERPEGPLVQPRRTAARPGSRRARHEGVERTRSAPRRARGPRRRRRGPDDQGLGARHPLGPTRWNGHTALAGLGLGR